MAGIMAGEAFLLPLWCWGGFALAAAGVIAWGLPVLERRGRLRFAFFMLLFSLGGISARVSLSEAESLTRFYTQAGAEIVVVEGRVSGLPVAGDGWVEADLAPETLKVSGKGVVACPGGGRVRLRIYQEVLREPALTPGDALSVRVKLEAIRDGENPGDPPWPRIMAARRIFARGTVGDESQLLFCKPRTVFPGDLIWRGRQALVHRFYHGGAGEAVALAMLTGEAGFLGEKEQEAFRRAGLAHLLSVSGLHLGLVFGLVGRVMGLAGAAPLAGNAAGAVAAAGYAVWVGWPVSAARSALTLLFSLLAGGRERAGLGLLALAALLILLDSPLRLLDIGFRFSFLGTLALCVVPALVSGRMAERRDHRRFYVLLVGVAAGGAVSALVQAVILPVQVNAFGSFSPWSPVWNLLAVPLSGLLVPVSLGAGVVGLISPPAGEVVFRGVAFLGDILCGMVRWGASLPGARVSLPVLPSIWAGVYYLLLVKAFAAWVPSPIPAAARQRRRRGLIWSGVWVIFCLVWGLWGYWPGRLEVTFLSVGLGSAVHLRIPGGHHVLVDAGPVRGRYDAGAKVVVPYLEKRGVNRLDLLILTHLHQDHAGGSAAVLERFPRALRVERAAPGDVWEWGRVRLEVLAGGKGTGTGENSESLALRLSWGNFSCLFLGDLDQKGQKDLMASGKTGPVTVLQVAHHGSRYSFLPELAAAVRPALAVISVGPNSYGHPHAEVLEWFRTQKTPLIRTDQRGAVVISADGRSTVYTAVRPGG